METFAKQIKDARYESLMTLKEASEKLNVALSTLQAYESGQLTNPDYEFIVAVHDLYGISYKKLMGWEDKSNEDDYIYLARAMKGNADKERVCKIIDYMKKLAEEKK